MTSAPPSAVPEGPPGAHGGRAVARNATFATGRFTLAAVLSLWVTQFMLGVVGPAQFGVWALAGGLLPVLRLVDLGAGRAVTRAVAEASGQGDATRASAALAAGRGIVILLAAFTLIAVWATRGWLVGLAAVPEALAGLAAYVLVGTALAAAVEGVFAPYQAALDGLGRMDVTSSVDTVQRVASAAGTVLVLAAGWGLPGLVWKNVATALAAGLAYRRLLSSHAPELAAAPWAVERGAVRRLLAFGRHVQAVNLAAVLVDPLTKVLLSRNAGLDTVALWELALRIASQAGGAFLALATSLFPAAAARRAQSGAADDAALAGLLRPAARYVGLVALPAFGLLAALAGPFVAAWLGPGYAPVASAIAVLSAGWLGAVLGLPAFLVAQAGGRERLATRAGLVTSGLSLGLALLFVRPFGLQGVAVAVASGLAAGGLVASLSVGRWLGLRGRGLLAVPGWAWAATGLAMAGAIWLAGALAPGWAGVILAVLAGLALYAGVLAATGILGPDERAFLRSLLPERREVGGA